MRRTVRILPHADLDLDEHFAYLAAQDLDVAVRFLEAVTLTFKTLLRIPGIGSAREFNNPRLAGLRQWPIKGFERHLVFYTKTPAGVTVVRVLHSSRDLAAILAEE